MDSDTVAAYLDRIGASRPSAPTAAALRDLHRRHLATVPFENLAIHLGEPITLTEDALVEKIVGRGRGGFCYELNGLFAALLDALGFDVTLLAASTLSDGGATSSPPFDHLALLVELDERFLADVGFGTHAVHPLRLDWPAAQEDPSGSFLVVDAAHGDIEVSMNGEPSYRAERRPRRLSDFVRPCWWQANSPDSHFRSMPRCSRMTDTGRVTIRSDRLIETVRGERTETTLTTDAEILGAYEKHFGFRLQRVPSPPTCLPPGGTSPPTTG
jgi:N-hydroxyarylamine O-acetyltransferase